MAAWGVQFSAGDHGPNRRKFWDAHFKVCPIETCKCTQFNITRDVAGCRMNGDAYGTNTFECSKCGWKTTFQWDEAGDDYYYDNNYSRTK